MSLVVVRGRPISLLYLHIFVKFERLEEQEWPCAVTYTDDVLWQRCIHGVHCCTAVQARRAFLTRDLSNEGAIFSSPALIAYFSYRTCFTPGTLHTFIADGFPPSLTPTGGQSRSSVGFRYILIYRTRYAHSVESV